MQNRQENIFRLVMLFWCFRFVMIWMLVCNLIRSNVQFGGWVFECVCVERKTLTQLVRQKKRPVHHRWGEFYDDTNRIATIEHVLVAMDGCVYPLCHQMWDHDLQCAKAIATCFVFLPSSCLCFIFFKFLVFLLCFDCDLVSKTFFFVRCCYFSIYILFCTLITKTHTEKK